MRAKLHNISQYFTVFYHPLRQEVQGRVIFLLEVRSRLHFSTNLYISPQGFTMLCITPHFCILLISVIQAGWRWRVRGAAGSRRLWPGLILLPSCNSYCYFFPLPIYTANTASFYQFILLLLPSCNSYCRWYCHCFPLAIHSSYCHQYCYCILRVIHTANIAHARTNTASLLQFILPPILLLLLL